MEMIVKVQMPLFVVGGPAQYLIYNADRSLQTLMPLGEDVEFDDIMMEEIEETGIPKVYFKADFDKGVLSFNEIARLPEAQQF